MFFIRAALIIAIVGAGCGRARRGAYVRAEPLAEPPRQPAVVTVTKPMPLPGQLRPVPGPVPETPAASGKPEAIVEAANRQGTRAPDRESYFDAMATYDFAEGALYQVYGAPLRLTDIALQPGEQLVGRPACGDTVRWVLGVGRSSDATGSEVVHVYVKPTRAGLRTTLAINTNRRTYHVELRSFDETYMAMVTWRYPQDEVARLEGEAAARQAEEATITASQVRLDALSFRYSVTVGRGKKTPKWLPEQVFDDGRKTFIRFPASMSSGEAPALFVLPRQGEDGQLVNYRVRNGFYVVDRIFEAAELRLGEKNQEVVRITRK
jgi:P-type conjugative transfer protein TrbG